MEGSHAITSDANVDPAHRKSDISCDCRYYDVHRYRGYIGYCSAWSDD
jgi:hypothetical protein